MTTRTFYNRPLLWLLFWAAFTMPGQAQECTVDNEYLFAGVSFPQPDIIPQIRNPEMVTRNDPHAAYLDDSDLVIGVVVGTEKHAIPHKTLWTHEMVNTMIDDHPVAISHCPLTVSSLAFDRTINGQTVELVVSGFLFNNNLIMNDTRELNFFPQMCVDANFDNSGAATNKVLTQLPTIEATWGLWKKLHPATLVVSDNSVPDHGFYPYTSQGDYRTADNYILFPYGPTDTRYDRKDLTYGVVLGGQSRAYVLKDLSSHAVLNDIVNDTPIAVVHDRAGRYTVAFERETVSGMLTFVRLSETPVSGLPFEFYDEETGSRWNIKGEAVDGPLTGTTLTQVATAYTAFWFAWSAFRPNIEVPDPANLEKTPTTDIITGIELEQRGQTIPHTPRLYQNYPNPFNPDTRIRFDLSLPGTVVFRIYNVLGQLISNRTMAGLDAGSYDVHWDGKDDNGNDVQSGMYFYQVLQGTTFRETRKMLLLK
jgi:hypothetical protein